MNRHSGDGIETTDVRRVDNREKTMKCSEVMKHQVTVAHAKDSLRAAAERMAHHHVSFLPVINDERVVVGVITDHDLVERGMAHGLDAFHTPVTEVTTTTVLSCTADDDTSVAEQKMKEHHRSRVVVVDAENKLAGLLTLSDLAAKKGEAEGSQLLKDVKGA
jgi:CBS domain-containing protein